MLAAGQRDKRWAISTGWLNTLPCVHLPPIELVVYQRPAWSCDQLPEIWFRGRFPT